MNKIEKEIQEKNEVNDATILINEFVNYLISEKCEGCPLCIPLSKGKQSVVCREQGFANWLVEQSDNFLRKEGFIL